MNINTFTHALVAGKDEAVHLENLLVHALQYAEQNGLVATIERKALLPLAQGNHEPVIVIGAVKELGMQLEAALKAKVESISSEVEAAIKKDFK